MKKLLLLIAIFFTTFCFGQSTDLPKNAKKGECYVRCFDTNGEATELKKINCEFAKDFNSKDEIIKIQYKLINLEYEVEATGFLDDKTIDAYIHFKKNEKRLLRKKKRAEKKANKKEKRP